MLKATLLKAAGSPTLRRQVSKNPVARRVAGRFVAGTTLAEVEVAIAGLRASGALVALDHLGENTTSAAQAKSATAAYLAALDRIGDGDLEATVSIKLTALGLDIGDDLAIEEASKVAARAKEVGTLVEVDMEAHEYVDPTLRVVDVLRQSYDNVGVAIQAMLYRTRDDLERLIEWQVPVRLVKGAYLEPPEVAYPDKASVDGAYARLLDRLMQAGAYPKVGTQDPAMVRLAKTLAAKYRRERDTFEFQMLYGVRRDLQDQVLAEGYRLRVYVPYGDQWYPYLMRRMAERPANLYFFISNLLKR